MNNEFQMVARTFQGLEEVLSNELEQLGAKELKKLHRAVSFSGNMNLLYRANYELRTCLSILKPLREFTADDEHELYDAVRQIEWEKLMNPDGTIYITPVCNGNVFTHSLYAAQKTKDAIADRMRQRFNTRPTVTPNDPDLHLNLRISGNRVTLSLDSSGDSLHRRGYRINQGPAPLNEVLAAGMIQLTEWDRKSHFTDPMCGSGTLLIEAAMWAMNIPAQYYRKKFAFQHWSEFSKEEWKRVKQEADNKIQDFDYEIIGSDISMQSIRIAEENIRNAKLHKDITLLRADLRDFNPPEGKVLTIINPPYGERLVPKDIDALYADIGSTLKNKYKENDVWIISSDKTAVNQIGLHASKKYSLLNGKLPCQFLKYEIYEGSKKAKHASL